MYSLTLSPRARKALRKISTLYKQEVVNAIEELKEDPFSGKALRDDLTKRYSYKIGVYRIIYTINQKDKLVSIISAGHRAMVYE